MEKTAVSERRTTASPFGQKREEDDHHHHHDAGNRMTGARPSLFTLPVRDTDFVTVNQPDDLSESTNLSPGTTTTPYPRTNGNTHVDLLL